MCKIKVEDITEAQWKKIYDAIDDMILFQVEPQKLLYTVIDTEPTSTFLAESDDFEDGKDLQLEFRIFKAKAEVEIKDERKRISVYVGLECTRARLYDYDSAYIELPQVLCDKITVNMKPITYGLK